MCQNDSNRENKKKLKKNKPTKNISALTTITVKNKQNGIKQENAFYNSYVRASDCLKK